MKKIIPHVILTFITLGIIDSLYLTWEHFSGVIPPCSIYWWITDCGQVLRSSYSYLFGVPLALLGVFHYTTEFILFLLVFWAKKTYFRPFLLLQSSLGVLFSAYFVYLMLGVIGAICLYCFGSAIISFLIFILYLTYYLATFRST